MELLTNLTDDQFALVCSAAALVTTGSFMALSYYLRPKRLRQADRLTTATSTRTTVVAAALRRAGDQRSAA